MPDLTTLAIAGGIWMVLLIVAWALCAAASRGEGGASTAEQEVSPRAAVVPVVADTGGIRARLRAAGGLVDADQLTVTMDVDGTTAVLASSRPVLAAEEGDWHELAVPIRLGGRNVATLRAVRRPGTAPFDSTDRLMLQALAVRVASSMEAARTAHDRRPTALA